MDIFNPINGLIRASISYNNCGLINDTVCAEWIKHIMTCKKANAELVLPTHSYKTYCVRFYIENTLLLKNPQ